ncbi:hypothetical protein ABVT39_011223 [Epinephelus coioides]
MHADIMAAVEAETGSILAKFGTEDLAKIVLITIKAAVPAIVKAVQKQLDLSVGKMKVNNNILECKYREDELEQYSRKENIRINGMEEQSGEESDDQLIEKVCNLAAAPGSVMKEEDISLAHRLGGVKKQRKMRPVIVRFGMLMWTTKTLDSGVQKSHCDDLLIITLNVCGLRSKIEVPDFIEMCKKYEVVCFCETKTDNMDIPDLTEKFNHMGFQVFKNRHNLTNWRSGGVMIAVKKAIGHKCVQRAVHSDACVCVQMNKNMLNYEKDLVILAAYVPPYMSRYSNSGILDDLTQVIIELSVDTNYILVCGDMNAHTYEREDWIIDEEEIDEEEYNEETVCTAKMLELADIPLRRKSVDICKDYGGNGTVLLDMCKNLVLCIINGRCGEDKYVGKATSTDHTVIDYMIVSLSTLSRIKQFYVDDFDCLLSDKHCVVELVLGGNHKDQKVEPGRNYTTAKRTVLQSPSYP